MTATTLDPSTWADGQPARQLADAVAALWSAGTGLMLQPAAVMLDDTHASVVLAEPSPPGAPDEPLEAVLSHLDRPFGRRAADLSPYAARPPAYPGARPRPSRAGVGVG